MESINDDTMTAESIVTNDKLLKEQVNDQSIVTNDINEAYERNTVKLEDIKVDRSKQVEYVADKFIRRIYKDSGEDALDWRRAIMRNAWTMSEWRMDQIYEKALKYYKNGLTRYFLACLRNEREKSK